MQKVQSSSEPAPVFTVSLILTTLSFPAPENVSYP
jgi:hypothetical protein